MPLVAHSALPTFTRLKEEGEYVLQPGRAHKQDIRELHIGLLNMMPDSALQSTERQFMRLIGNSNRIAQFHMHPFTLAGIERNPETQRYINQHYYSFEDLAQQGLDALIITGANVSGDFVSAPFWSELTAVLDYARAHITSTLCACLATHAALQHFYGIERRPLPQKRWGVYSHRTSRGRVHPLIRTSNTKFDVPHSRFNDVSEDQLTSANLRVLINSADAGFHLGVSEDLFRFVFLQGHPEYDRNSLLKEYKREVMRFLRAEVTAYPPLPENYLTKEGREIATKFRQRVLDSNDRASLLGAFPEETIEDTTDNTWRDSARTVFSNWIGLVYQITHQDRKKPFMKGINPEDPLGLRFPAA